MKILVKFIIQQKFILNRGWSTNCTIWILFSLISAFCQKTFFECKCDFHREVQRGSESRTCLDSSGLKEVGLQIVRTSNEIWSLEAWQFEIQTNGHHSVKPFGLQTKVTVFKRSGPELKLQPNPMKTGLFEIRSLEKSPAFYVF